MSLWLVGEWKKEEEEVAVGGRRRRGRRRGRREERWCIPLLFIKRVEGGRRRKGCCVCVCMYVNEWLWEKAEMIHTTRG